MKLKNKEGKSLIDIAIQNKHIEIIHVMMELSNDFKELLTYPQFSDVEDAIDFVLNKKNGKLLSSLLKRYSNQVQILKKRISLEG